MTEDMEELKNQKSFLLKRLDCQEQDISKAERELKSIDSITENLEKQNASMEAQKQADSEKYREIYAQIPEEKLPQLQEECREIRSSQRSEFFQKAGDILAIHQHFDLLQSAEKAVDRELPQKKQNHPALNRKRTKNNLER